ncbi:MAG TPA: hypothetical protein VEG39_01650 [Clostridia bacterium]|nr:hypothetical protein [Clostridia bacterium]
MNKCKKIDCQSNRDGVCLGNWAECPEQKPGFNIDIRIISLSIIIILLIASMMSRNIHISKLEDHLNALSQQITAEHAAKEVPEVYKGQYTIFQYTQNGWSNHMYVTEFSKEDGFLYYKLKDHPDEYMFIKAEEFLPVPGWVEGTDDLMEYGFWEPIEFEF